VVLSFNCNLEWRFYIIIEEINLFEKRTEKIRKLVENAKIVMSTLEEPAELTLIALKLKNPLNGIYLEDILKISTLLRKEISSNTFEIILKILYPFLDDTRLL
jgi:hypothetical protein